MKIWILAMGYLLMAPGARAAENSAEPFPVTVVSEMRYAFGSVVEGTEVLHDFVIRNRGNAPLNIQEVKTT
jgi:hypothetical protein